MSKGGSTTSKTEIPAWLEGAAIENINKARGVSELGYVPYFGPDVAAFSPMQQQSMQSTGNAASAFGLAPQGFDAMAGMPQAQSFAGGIQGYSSAPLYEESLAQLQQNRPAQYKAMTDMFTDPFTGARPSGDYTATPAQVEQMFSNSGGGGGGISPNGGGGNSSGNNDGEYFGVNSQYNPYGYSTPTENISGEKDRVADYRDMSFGEDGRRDIGFGENVGNFIKNITPIGTIERGIDYGQGLADGFTPSPSNGLLSQTSGPSMENDEAVRRMNEGSDRYEAQRLADQYDLYGAGQNFNSNVAPATPYNAPDAGILADQYALYGAGQNFTNANNPTNQVDLLAATVAARNAAKEEAEIEAQEKITLERIARETAVSNAKAAAPAKKKAKEKATTGGKSSGTVGDKAGNVVKDGSGNAVNFGKPKPKPKPKKKPKPKPIVANSGSKGGGGDSSSAGSSGGGTYCCTKMRDNGKWTSNRRVYKMHKWHFEQPQWWRDGYDVWGKVIADNLLNKNSDFSASVMNDFYEQRVNGGKLTAKSAIAHVVMYPAIFTIGMVAKVAGKHITRVTITS